MAENAVAQDSKKGGRFLLEPTNPDEVFTLEDFGEEDRMFAQTAYDFCTHEVLPLKKQIENEQTKIETTLLLLRKAGELGLLGVEVPEEFGGLGGGVSTGMLVAQSMTREGSFTASLLCHTGIGTLPIVFFGTQEQREKYLPKLTSGEWAGAYALTEEGYGSDALGAKTRAVKSEDGKFWILNGTKQFITNAGFAHVYTVYAKVDGEHFTCFIVDADTPGLSTGPEEHKMGIKGSSTRQLILENVHVPVENVLGEIGKGHKVALNILNLGRLKLGVGSMGASKEILKQSLKYSSERQQFGKPINHFQLIQEKLADMALDIYAGESMAYRCCGDIDRAIDQIEIAKDDPRYLERKVACVEEFAIEDSILKVFGSEALGRIVDHAVQIHGGYGFVEEYAVCGAYRDARINRLFEGTNEINRMLMPGTLMRRAMKGQIDVMTPIMTLMEQIKADAVRKEPAEGVLGREKTAVELLRKWATLGLGVPAQKAMGDPAFMQENQIILEQLADLFMDLYAAESSLLRTLKMIAARGEEKCAVSIRLTEVIVYERLRHAMELVRQICANTALGNESDFARNRKAMQRLLWDYGVDTMSRKASLAKHLIEREDFILE